MHQFLRVLAVIGAASATITCGAGSGGDTTCDDGEIDCEGLCVDVTTDGANCGACGEICIMDNATAGCVDGECVIVSCETGFFDIDGNATNGCESQEECVAGTPCPNGQECIEGYCVCPGGEGQEVNCDDGEDNDCDGDVDGDDEDCVITGCDLVVDEEDLRLTNAEGQTSFPVVVPTTTNGFAMVFDDDRQDPSPPDLHFYNTRQVFFATFDSEGTEILAPVPLSAVDDGDASRADVAATGDGSFGVVFEQSGQGVLFALISEEGVIEAGPVVLDSELDHSPSIAWNGEAFGVVFSGRQDVMTDHSQVTFVSVDRETNVSEPTVMTSVNTGAYDLFPQIAWDDDGAFGVAWQDRRNGSSEIFFLTINVEGTLASDELQVTAAAESLSAAPELTWAGVEYALVYSDTRGNLDLYEVYLARVAADGSEVIAEHQISHDETSNSDTPAVVTFGGVTWVAWVDKPWGEPGSFSLSSASPAIDAGADIGLPFNGAAPDIGAVEHGTSFAMGEGPSEINIARVSPATGGTEPVLVSGNQGFSAFPSFASLDQGLALVWFDSRDGQSREIYATVMTCED